MTKYVSYTKAQSREIIIIIIIRSHRRLCIMFHNISDSIKALLLLNTEAMRWNFSVFVLLLRRHLIFFLVKSNNYWIEKSSSGRVEACHRKKWVNYPPAIATRISKEKTVSHSTPKWPWTAKIVRQVEEANYYSHWVLLCQFFSNLILIVTVIDQLKINSSLLFSLSMLFCCFNESNPLFETIPR